MFQEISELLVRETNEDAKSVARRPTIVVAVELLGRALGSASTTRLPPERTASCSRARARDISEISLWPSLGNETSPTLRVIFRGAPGVSPGKRTFPISFRR